MRFTYRYGVNGIVCTLLLCPSLTAGQGVGQPAETDPNSKKITLKLKNASLSDVVNILGETYGINVVADAYADDVRFNLDLPQVTRAEALQNIPKLYEREVRQVGNILVWRHKHWFRRPEQEKFSAAHYRLVWRTKGTVAIHMAPRSTTIISPHAAVPTVLSSASNRNFEPSDFRVSITANQVSLRDLAAAFTAQTPWALRAESSLAPRRVSTHLTGVSGGQAIEALTILFNGREEVTIGLSDEDRKLAGELTDDWMKARGEREKLSDQLKASLLDHLNADQRNSLAQGNLVDVPLHGLPSALQQLGFQYIQVATDGVSSVAGFAVDTSRMSEFSLQVRPEPWLNINVIGFGPGGQRVGY